MNLEIRAIPAFEDNYIWVIGRTGDPRVVIVDPGDADPVLAALEEQNLQPAAILVTHHHGDHTGGVRKLASRFELSVYGPDDPRITGLTHAVGEGDPVVIGDSLRFQVFATPGHTRSHICYLLEDALFCGDTLFTAGCGGLFEGTPPQMYASLSKFDALPDSTRVYCAHEYTLENLAFAAVAEPLNDDIQARLGEARARRSAGLPTVPSDLGLERRTNPFLRCKEAALVAAAEEFSGRKLVPGAEVFAVVRHWKDTFDNQ